MGKEYETQILEVNPTEIAEKLRKLGAKEEEEYLQKRWVFEISCSKDGEYGKGKDQWVRLREAKGKTTITYKNKVGLGLGETEEIGFGVDDFGKAAELLGKLKCFSNKYYQENRRHKFTINGIEFTLDSWPKIPTFLEIEGESEEKVHEGISFLGLEKLKHENYGPLNIYSKYGFDLHSFKEIKFE